jgi:hypothetical protein
MRNFNYNLQKKWIIADLDPFINNEKKRDFDGRL